MLVIRGQSGRFLGGGGAGQIFTQPYFIPQRRGSSLEPSPRDPFGLSALFLFKLLLDFFGFPLGTRATYCVVGGAWWAGGGWGVFWRI